MQARLSAVQSALFWLLAASLAATLLARPHPENRRYMDALEEVEAFQHGFDRERVTHSLLQVARDQAAQPLTALPSAVSGPKVPRLQIEKNAPALQPMAALELNTLADVHARAQPHGTLGIGVAELAPLGAALSWRLTRLAPGPFTLQAVELARAEVGQADVDLEREAARLRLASLQAESGVEAATKKLEAAELTLERHRKWKLPWKVLVKSEEARRAAKTGLDQETEAARAAATQYENAAKRALSPRPLTNASDLTIPSFALAQIKLTQGSGASTIAIPIAIEQRQVSIASLQGGEFAATRAAGLWDEVKNLDAAHASVAIRAHFNWHYRYVQLLGIKLGGMTVLQFVPCLLPLLLCLLVIRMRAVGGNYNPFGTTVNRALPRVGFRHRALECLVVVVLPFLAAASAAASLLLVRQVPALPVLTAIACLLLGGYAFTKLGELQSLVEDVARSHSNPPSETP
jgi:hypothetical protein